VINIIEPRFFEEEEEAILSILRSRKITRGEWTKAFEEAFAKYLGVKHAFTVCSGTVALFIALKALGVERAEGGCSCHELYGYHRRSLFGGWCAGGGGCG
jgi:Predicted pyridoxal phosphate-dependent enzyme apparently involved in regulation of cell wall biogenesis